MKKVFVILLTIILLPIILFISIFCWQYITADLMCPKFEIDITEYKAVQNRDTVFCHDSYLYHSKSGLWELYIAGSGIDKGAKQGALTAELMRFQEDVFIDQINKIVPSESYLGFLRKFLIIFNRNIAEHIALEYREEIAAMSLFCTDEYNAIGTPYERQLNYHAAHDIGHTMQQYMLVGCSSFAVWGAKSEDEKLLIGRNFDFYVGDDFAKNKIITFASPDNGYKYASIAWAGMVGVLSGMNEQGLTVTINAAKGDIPTSAKTPISILTREILQYASTIEEAYEIASSRKTFVSESILIGSSKDGKAAIIEKTPAQTAIYYNDTNQILCTNHFQSSELKNSKHNIANITDSDSKYRFERIEELLSKYSKVEYNTAANILRDRYGSEGEDIGIGNEMTLNQSIAHHSVIFLPVENLMWVSTSPWQSGNIICYDLSGFFNDGTYPSVIDEKSVVADSLFIQNDLPRLINYRKGIEKINNAIDNEIELSEEFIADFQLENPNHYYTYRILGDYFKSKNETVKAKMMYDKSLLLSIPYKSERAEISNIIKTL